MGYSSVKKGYRCYCPTLRRYFVSTDVVFFETTLFSLSSTIASHGEEDDDLLVKMVSLPVPTSAPAPIFISPALVPIKPHITQVNSQSQNLQSQLQHQLLRHQIQSRMMIFQLLSVKVNVSVLTKYLNLFPITICRIPLIPLLHPLILSLFLTLIVRLYITLVSIVLWWKKCRL